MASDVTNIELYEELKKSLTEPAARMIAEVVPLSEKVATTDHIAGLDRRLDQVDRRFDQLETKMYRWTVTFFVPMWVGVFAVLVAIAWRI